MSQKALKVLSKQPQNIVNIINLNTNGGDLVSNKYDGKTIVGSFNNSELSDNIAIQSENVIQTQNKRSPELEQALSQLNDLINELPEELEKIQAESVYNSLEQSIENEDTSKSGKFLEILTKTLGVVPPLLTIAKSLGVPLPEQ